MKSSQYQGVDLTLWRGRVVYYLSAVLLALLFDLHNERLHTLIDILRETLHVLGATCWNGRVLFFSTIVFTPLLLTLRPESIVRRTLYYVPILMLCGAFFAPLGESGSYQFGILFATWTLRILDRLYLNQPEETFRYKGQEHVSPTSFTPLKKLWWAFELIAVTRGVGWNWEIRQLPAIPHLSRRGFLLWKTRSAIFTVSTLMAIRYASASILQLYAERATSPCLHQQLLLHPFVLYPFMYSSWAFVVFASLSLAENISAIVFVGLNLTERWSKPEMWPPIFGSIKESYSIRRSWGIFWHQNMRRICQSPGNFVVGKIAYLKNQTKVAVFLRRNIRLLSVFFFSGVIHAGGSIHMTRYGQTAHDGGNTIGFLYQGLAMIAEDLLLQRLGVDDSMPPSLARRLIGYAIVHGYGSYAVPALKVMPLAADHGLMGSGSPLMSGVEMTGNVAMSILRNPFATIVGSIN